MLRLLALIPALSLTLACGGAPTSDDGRPHLPPNALLVEAEIVATPHAHDGRSRGGPVIARPTRGPIVWMRYSSDGRALVVLDSAGTLALVDPLSGQVRASRRITARPQQLTSVSLSGAADRALLGLRPASLPHQLLLWDLAQDRFVTLAEARPDRALHAPTLSWDGRVIAYASEETEPEEGRRPRVELVVLEIESGVSARHAIDRVPEQLELTRSGRVLIRRDGARLVFHDAHHGQEVGRFEPAGAAEGQTEEADASEADAGAADPEQELRRDHGHRLEFSQPRFGGAVLAADGGSGFRLLDPRDARPLGQASVQGEALRRTRWDSMGGRIFAVGGDGTVTLFNGATLEQEGTLPIPEGAAWAHRFALSEDGRTVYVVTHGAGLIRRDRQTDERASLVPSLPDDDVGSRELTQHPPFVLLAPDESSLAFARGRSIFLVDPAGGRPPVEIRGSGGEPAVLQLEFRPDSRGLYSLGRSGSEIWDAEQGGRNGVCSYDGSSEVIFDPEGRAHLAGCVLGAERRVEGFILGYSPTGRWLLMGPAEEGGGLRVVDAESGETRATLAHTEGTEVVCDQDELCRPWGAIREDGGLVALTPGEGGEITLYDGARGRRLRHLTSAIAPASMHLLDRALLVLDLDGNGALYDAQGGRLRAQSDPDRPGVAIAPDRRTIALPSAGGVTFVDAASLQPREVAAEGASNLAFSRDGSTLFYVDPDSQRLTRIRVAEGTVLPPVSLPEGLWVDPRTVSGDASEILMCRGGRLVVERLGQEAEAQRRDAAACPAALEGLTLSPDGRFAAGRRGSEVFLFRLSDGATLLLRRFRDEGRLVPFASTEEGRFWAPAAGLRHLLVRGPGPSLRAPLSPAEGSSLLDAALLRSFFGEGGGASAR